MLDLTDEEQEFLDSHRNVFDILRSIGSDREPGSWGEATDFAKAFIEEIAERYPSRTKRIMLLSAIGRMVNDSRDALLEEVLRGGLVWTRNDETGHWNGFALQDWEATRLASLCGLTVQTIRNRNKKLVRETLLAAMKEAGDHYASPLGAEGCWCNDKEKH